MKKLMLCMIIFMLSIGVSIQVMANSGPPQNISLEILNFTKHFEIDFLIPFDRPLNEADIQTAQDQISFFDNNDFGIYYQDDYPSFLINFQDKDGYVSNTLYGASDYFYRFENEMALYMNLPRQFKIVLINSDNQLIISDVVEMEAYDQAFIWDLKGVTFEETIQYNVGIFEGLNINPFGEVRKYQELVIRIMITILIEFSVFYLLGYRLKQTFIKYGILNILSQTLLTLGLIYGIFIGNGAFANVVWLLLGELLVFGFEMGINGLMIKEKYTSHIVFSTFLANLASLILGTIISLELYRLLW
jgi:hypothetical protein